MKSDAIKKNLFWILAGVAPFLTFLTFVVIFLSVGGEVTSKSEAITKDLTELGGTKAKGTKGLSTMDKQKEVIAQQKQKLWEANWNQQLKLFTWPNNPDLKVFESKYQKFGEKLQVVNDEFNTFKTKTTYEAAYDRMAESVKPSQFASNNWRAVLRYVSDWTERTPQERQIWLALEDLWVQKGLLEPIAAVNASAAVFAAVDDGKEPLKRKFRSRVWDLDLEVPKEGKLAGKVILAKLTNRTDRMQLLGNGKTMNLRVWLSDGGTPIAFRLEGAFLKANETVEVKLNENLQGIPPGTDVRRLARVEHVPDGRTVPIRRIDAIQLGKVDARHAAAVLKQPKFLPDEVVADASGGSSGGMAGMTMPAGGGADGPGGGGGGMSGPMGRGGRGGASAAANSGPPLAVLDGNKNRYIDVTDQVRRMPVALVLVVDQMYLQDTLVAFANSSLRFQVTQYHWKRFRGTLASSAESSGATGGPDTGDGGGPPSYPGAGGGGVGPDAMSSGGGRGSRGGFGMASGSVSPGGGSDSFGGGGPGGFSPPSGIGGGGGATVSDAQATSGLVELTIYGIITLYEKYDAKVADGTAPVAPEPAPKAATPPATTVPGD